MSNSVFLGMKTVSGKSCRDTLNTHFMFNKVPRPENRSVSEIMLNTFVESGRPQMTIWRMRIACWIPKDYRHTQYIILIVFPLQQWLHEDASVLRYTYSDRLVVCNQPWYVACCSGEESVCCEVDAQFWSIYCMKSVFQTVTILLYLSYISLLLLRLWTN